MKVEWQSRGIRWLPLKNRTRVRLKRFDGQPPFCWRRKTPPMTLALSRVLGTPLVNERFPGAYLAALFVLAFPKYVERSTDLLSLSLSPLRR